MKAVVYVADGSEEIEMITPVDYLRRAGVEVTLCAVGKTGPVVRCSHGVTVTADMTLDEYLASRKAGELPDAVIVPGGMPGASNIASCPRALSLLEEQNAAGRLVCAICAAPAVVLGKTSCLNGRQWTCYPGMEGEASAFVAGHTLGVPFVHDGNLVTGRGPGAAEEFAMEIVTALAGEPVAAKIREGSVQRPGYTGYDSGSCA